MKIVKVCPDCLKYNSYKLYECAFCGANLSDDVKEVNDDETEDKREEIIETEKSVEKEIINKSNNSLKVCPMCGSGCDSEWCDNCGNYLEGISETVATVSKESELKFKLKYEGNEFNYIANENEGIIGRNDFSSLNNPDFISISRSHLKYKFVDGALYFIDVSSYGSYINGKKMEKDKEYRMNNHDKIKFVYYEMEIEF